VLKVPGIEIFDAFGVISRQLRGQNIFIFILLPYRHVLENHRPLFMHACRSCRCAVIVPTLTGLTGTRLADFGRK
jgi:hypothetical protein